jgi:hypothetical protein
MKPLLFTLALGSVVSATIGFAATARAGHDDTLPEVTVKQDANRLRTDCKPPAYARACESLHAQVRQAFSKREIALLFGAGSALAEYRTHGASMQARYEDFLREIDVYGASPTTASVE